MDTLSLACTHLLDGVEGAHPLSPTVGQPVRDLAAAHQPLAAPEVAVLTQHPAGPSKCQRQADRQTHRQTDRQKGGKEGTNVRTSSTSLPLLLGLLCLGLGSQAERGRLGRGLRFAGQRSPSLRTSDPPPSTPPSLLAGMGGGETHPLSPLREEAWNQPSLTAPAPCLPTAHSRAPLDPHGQHVVVEALGLQTPHLATELDLLPLEALQSIQENGRLGKVLGARHWEG